MATVTGTVAADWGALDAVIDMGDVRVAATWGGCDVLIDTTPQARTGSVDASWGGLDVDVAIGDHTSVTIYDPATGREFQAATNKAKVTYRIELGQPGTAEVAVRVEDPAAASVVDRAIIRTQTGHLTEAARVNGEALTLTEESPDQVWLTLSEMPTLLGCLADGPIYPPGGLPATGEISRTAPATRTFGPMNPRSAWYIAADWAHCIGVTPAADTTHRKNHPAELAGTSALWIAPSPGPEADQAQGTVVHYRCEINITAATDYEFVGTADNFWEFWIDDIQVLPPNYDDLLSWRGIRSVTGTFNPGNHVLYARVENGADARGINPLGLIGVLFRLDNKGDHHGVLTKTDTTHWLGTSAEVGWYPGQILRQAMHESGMAGDAGVAMLTPTFDWQYDSNGVHYTGPRVTRTYQVMTDNLMDLVSKLRDDGLDVTANARDMTVGAYQRLGSDLSGTVELVIEGAGSNLLSADMAKTGTRATVAVAVLADGRWHTVEDTAGIAAIGRVVLPIQLGTTSSPLAAEPIMRQLLAQTAAPVTSAKLQTSMLRGPQYGVEYRIGDTILIPDGRGSSSMPQRVFAYNMDATGDRPKVWAEFIQDTEADPPRSGPKTQADRLKTIIATQAYGSAWGLSPNTSRVLPITRPSQGETVVVVIHGADPNVARPTARYVKWVGSATPAAIGAFDEHYDGDEFD